MNMLSCLLQIRPRVSKPLSFSVLFVTMLFSQNLKLISSLFGLCILKHNDASWVNLTFLVSPPQTPHNKKNQAYWNATHPVLPEATHPKELITEKEVQSNLPNVLTKLIRRVDYSKDSKLKAKHSLFSDSDEDDLMQFN